MLGRGGGAQLLGLAAASATLIAFFLPWMDGEQSLRFHSFSGLDFARLVRNFEITAESQSEAGQIRATALLIYLMPGLVVNAAILRLASRVFGTAATFASIAAGAYGLLLLCVLAFLSVVQVNDFAAVVGAPRYGFVVSSLGCAVLLGTGLARLRYARSGRP